MQRPRSTVVVTGAASGMGRRLAERWSGRGLTVVGTDVVPGPLDDLVSGGVLAGREVVDVRDAAACRDAIARIETAHGPVETLVNAAGIIRPGRVAELTAADFRDTIEVNYLGTVHAVLAVLAGMQARGRGTIVNFASLAGWMPTPVTAPYTASKFAVVGFTESLAAEVRRDGIRVHATCPPAVDTPMLAGIRSHPSIPGRVTRLAPAITADMVIDGIERGLASGDLFSFPGPGTRTLLRLRRLSPRLLARTTRLLYGL